MKLILRLFAGACVFGLALSAFAQVAPELRRAEKSNWSYSLTYTGNDSYQDNDCSIPRSQSMSWDSRYGSLAMNGCEWVRSAWYGSGPKLCSVATMGTIRGLFIWKGSGPAPKEVTVRINSSLAARYSECTMTPTVILTNGLGSRTSTCRINGLMEAVAADTSVVKLPVQNGSATFSMGISGKATGLMNGSVALHSEFSAKPID